MACISVVFLGEGGLGGRVLPVEYNETLLAKAQIARFETRRAKKALKEAHRKSKKRPKGT